ncbi:hypothetical protein [Micromonospora aurantiaca (nom. illeg.)]|uniref:hypothetical protein n=1 Tax=Micromonospora aurantiaca (nom. illeg.) TaxID=47850 RepID=UPI00082884DA|nr:hypothetical protein [Micromonospora aurantiaca]SCL38333.1 hypothetical protein GA0070615_3671 [Micromonospora aurantiaca]
MFERALDARPKARTSVPKSTVDAFLKTQMSVPMSTVDAFLKARTSVPKSTIDAFLKTQMSVPMSTVDAFLKARTSVPKSTIDAFLKTQMSVPMSTVDAFLKARTSVPKSTIDAFLKTQMSVPMSTVDAFLKNQQDQIRFTLGKLDTRAALRAATTGLQSTAALVVDDALRDLERAVEAAEGQAATEGTTLLAVWSESLRDFRFWLLQPAVKWPAIGLISFLVAYWWVTLKTEHPDVADMIEVPFAAFTGLLLAMAANAKRE